MATKEEVRAMNARSTARRCLKPLFTRPVSPEQRTAVDNVTQAIIKQMEAYDELERAWAMAQ